MVHLAVITGIRFPERSIFGDMKPADVRLIELLHLCGLKQTVVVIAHPFVPLERPPLFHSGNDIIGFYDILGDFRHIAAQNAFIDAREALAIH